MSFFTLMYYFLIPNMVVVNSLFYKYCIFHTKYCNAFVVLFFFEICLYTFVFFVPDE